MIDSGCALCGKKRLSFSYLPEGTRRGASVCVCENCGLIQSVYNDPGSGVPFLSGGATGEYPEDTGAREALERISLRIDPRRVKRCLDIGSGSGSFVRALREINPWCEITAVEPDPRLMGGYPGDKGIEVLSKRVEDCVLMEGYYDLVRLTGALAYARDPFQLLEEVTSWLAPGGHLYVEIRDVSFISRFDVIEEFFQDGPSLYFSAPLLKRLLASSGLAATAGPQDVWQERLAFHAVREAGFKRQSGGLRDQALAEASKELLMAYSERRHENIESMARIGSLINSRAGNGVAVWGAGALLDCLIRFGNVENGALSAVIDSAGPKEAHGFEVTAPEAVSRDTQVFIIMSRRRAREIRAEIRERFGPDPEVYDYPTLIRDAGDLKKAV